MAAGTGRRLTPVPLGSVRIDDGFWTPRQDTNRTVTLPLEYELNRKSGAIGAHQWEWWDKAKGDPPWRIWVGDLGKWIEAVAYSLVAQPDPDLAARMEDVIQSIVKGQKEDGYIYPNALPEDWRFRNLQEWHELYELGHDIEGAVAHFQATGQRHFLDAVCRAADLLDRTFGTGEGRLRGYDGHPEIELALVKLYRATGEKRYLDLAGFFLDERGRQPHYFDAEREEAAKRGVRMAGWFKNDDYQNCQAHKPLREQADAVGHAVRALYLYSGAADMAAETGDAGLVETCRRLWRSIVRRRMYVIGGVGSSARGEALTSDYDLPNETSYAETCANIALVFFAHRMLQIEVDSEYADVMERALYNGVLSGVNLDGKRFFYANPLTAHPSTSPKGNAAGFAVAQRQEWFGCACCPPNIARLIASIGQYVYSVRGNATAFPVAVPATVASVLARPANPDADASPVVSAPCLAVASSRRRVPESSRGSRSSSGHVEVYVHLYIGGSVACEVNGRRVNLTQETEYPWTESVAIRVEPDAPVRFTLALRIPDWCRAARIKVNGKVLGAKALVRKGYARLTRRWFPGDRVELTLPMPVERIEANPAVRMDCGKVALQRGPIVYCLEEIDNGPQLADIFLPHASKLTAEYRPTLLGGCVVVTGRAKRRDAKGWEGQLYRRSASRAKTARITAIPYCLWANRTPGEMLVWIRGD